MSSQQEKTTNELPKKKITGEPTALIEEESVEKSPGLPRDTDFDDAAVDTRKRNRFKKEVNYVQIRSGFYGALEDYSLGRAFQCLSASKKVGSPFLAEMKNSFLNFLDECELRGMKRLTEAHKAWLGRLRADVETERFEAPTFMIAQLGRLGSDVGKEEGRRQREKLEAVLPEIKKEILLNAFWGSLRREERPDFVTAFYRLAQAKDWQMAEYANMKQEFLRALDKEMEKPTDEHAAALRVEIERMRRLVKAW